MIRDIVKNIAVYFSRDGLLFIWVKKTQYISHVGTILEKYDSFYWYIIVF